MSFSEELDAGRAEVMRSVRQASTEWAEAMRAHKMAPPDAGFADRLRALAEAARTEYGAWQHAHEAGLLWRPIPGAEEAEPPYELRPGTGRRGPAQLWERFDLAVSNLNRAISGSSAAEVAGAFGEMAEVAAALANAVAGQDDADRQQGAERARGIA